MSRRSRHICALLAAAVMGLIVLPITPAGAESGSHAKAGVKGVKKQVKKLKRQVRELQQQVDNLSRDPGPTGPEGPQGPQGTQGPPGPSTGPAGGDLTGTFPNPLIAANAVGSAEIADAAVGNSEIAEGAVGSFAVSDESLFAAELGATSVRESEIDGGAVGAFELDQTIAVVGTGVTVNAATPENAVVICPLSHRTILSGGFAWQEDEPNSIIASAPSENFPFNRWEVRGMVDAGSNVLFPWALCLSV